MESLSHRYRIAAKRLAPVDADLNVSNQHEFTGVNAFRQVLSDRDRVWREVPWVILRDSGEHEFESHYVRWYDSRSKQSHRAAEWRLYFAGSSAVAAGDVLTLILRDDDALGILAAPQGSSWESQLEALLGGPMDSHGVFVNVDLSQIEEEYVVVAREVLGLLGWAETLAEPDEELVDAAIVEFGSSFPTGRALSEFTRRRVPVDVEDADAALLAWWRAEERLFLGLERRLVFPKIEAGFDSVEDFVSYSLSVQNRRKSRAGNAFEGHLQALFEELDIRHSRGQLTEGTRRPDFLFPGVTEYRDPHFDETLLSMLGAKTTCKDRWRQVLNEAARIPEKHLCTLEPAISAAQLQEMSEESLTLVAPRSILESYDPPPGVRPISLGEFIATARDRQNAAS